MGYFEDHGLPLVQLKEQRRELVVALAGRNDHISHCEIVELALLQQAIAAMEAVVDDLDSQIELPPPRRQAASVIGIGRRLTARNMDLAFGRRAAPPSPLRLGTQQ